MPSFVVAQLGARRHYAVPRILHRAGLLERLYTDICAVKGWPALLRFVPRRCRRGGLRRLLERDPSAGEVSLPPERISAFTAFGWQYARRRLKALNRSELVRADLWAAKEFCRRIIARGLGRAGAVYGFNAASWELLSHARERGLFAVLDQTIAPRCVEVGLLTEEMERFQGCASDDARDELWPETALREAAEWQVADRIVCGSDYVAQSIAQAGGPVEKAVVVPCGVENGYSNRGAQLGGAPWHGPPSRPGGRALHVLFVGQVGLRKGAPYLFAAAARLGGAVQVRCVGNIALTYKGLGLRPANVELTGPVPRGAVGEQYAWADVFCLPSLCEGSAAVVYEALAAGVPVVTTPNAGSIVRDGVEGFIVPIRDPAALVEAIGRFVVERGLVGEMSRAARERSAFGSIEAYGQRLVGALLGYPTAQAGGA